MILIQRPLLDGTQVVYKFENGYGASVVCHEFSFGGCQGLKELAVLTFPDDDEHYELCDSTEITEYVFGYLSDEDVIGYLSDEDVADLLVKIEALEGK